jgi:hypothetical protein
MKRMLVSLTLVLSSLFCNAFAQNEIFYWAPADTRYDAKSGEQDALAHLRLGTVVLLMLGGPSSELEERVRNEEYRRHEIEWRWLGDVTTPEFEEYRRAFNLVMRKAVEDRMGTGFFTNVEDKIRTRMKKESAKSKSTLPRRN